jgi:hypothetical protein
LVQRERSRGSMAKQFSPKSGNVVGLRTYYPADGDDRHLVIDELSQGLVFIAGVAVIGAHDLIAPRPAIRGKLGIDNFAPKALAEFLGVGVLALGEAEDGQVRAAQIK